MFDPLTIPGFAGSIDNFVRFDESIGSRERRGHPGHSDGLRGERGAEDVLGRRRRSSLRGVRAYFVRNWARPHLVECLHHDGVLGVSPEKYKYADEISFLILYKILGAIFVTKLLRSGSTDC